MGEEIAVQPPPSSSSSVVRRQPLLSSEKGKCRRSRRESRMGEATGECAAVCCCCPCTVIHVVLMAVYRLPKSLCLWTKKKSKRRKSNGSGEGSAVSVTVAARRTAAVAEEEFLGENDVVDWDKEMMERFGRLGFFRSDSSETTVQSQSEAATAASTVT